MKMIAVLALSLPPRLDMTSLFLWLVPWTIINMCAGTVFSVPLSSWLIESSGDNADYIKIVTTAQNFGGIAGTVLFDINYSKHLKTN